MPCYHLAGEWSSTIASINRTLDNTDRLVSSVNHAATADNCFELVSELLEAGTPLMAEEKVELTRELSLLVARRPCP